MIRLFTMIALAAVVLTAGGCRPSEGERCNPLLFSDECSDGDSNLRCTYPTNCGVAYCCPVPDKVTATSSPNCQACPAPDMAGH